MLPVKFPKFRFARLWQQRFFNVPDGAFQPVKAVYAGGFVDFLYFEPGLFRTQPEQLFRRVDAGCVKLPLHFFSDVGKIR